MSRALLVLALLAAARGAGATVFAPLDDPALVGSSDIVVTGTVLGGHCLQQTSGRIVTRTKIAVDRILKGEVAGATVTVTTPGGYTGRQWAVVFGTPTFRTGDRVLAFLQHNRRGELRPNALSLGVYWLTTAPDGSLQAEHHVPAHEVRSFAGFVATISSLTGTTPQIRADVSKLSPTAVTEEFTFLGPPFSRWFQPDSGQTVRYKVANADANVGSLASNAIIDAAFAAWTNVPTATITLARGGTTSVMSAVGACDGESTIQFNDPFNDISPLVGCAGVLAIGGFCGSPTSTKVVGGTQFQRITEGDLTVADGLGACLNRAGFEEIVTHEVGHTIGMGHSSENPNEPNPTLKSATMYFLAHLDGRGASLRDDDIAGVSAIYPAMVDPSDLDGDGVANADDACPSTPSGAAVDATGCACGEAGHVACDDGLSCTTDVCEAATGACGSSPADCTGGNRCVVGSCDEVTGCQTTPVTGDAAAVCAFDVGFPPVDCAVDRVPRKVAKLFRRAQLLAGKAVAAGDARLAGSAVRKLDRALRAVGRAAARRRRPLGGGCAAMLQAQIGDARSRVVTWINQRSPAS